MRFDPAEVHVQDIRLDHRQLAMIAQSLRQVAIQFDNGQMPESLHQGLRQGGQAGANFDHALPGLWRNGTNDGINYSVVAQKVLPEAFTRDVFHGLLRRLAQLDIGALADITGPGHIGFFQLGFAQLIAHQFANFTRFQFHSASLHQLDQMHTES